MVQATIISLLACGLIYLIQCAPPFDILHSLNDVPEGVLTRRTNPEPTLRGRAVTTVDAEFIGSGLDKPDDLHTRDYSRGMNFYRRNTGSETDFPNHVYRRAVGSELETTDNLYERSVGSELENGLEGTQSVQTDGRSELDSSNNLYERDIGSELGNGLEGTSSLRTDGGSELDSPNNLYRRDIGSELESNVEGNNNLDKRDPTTNDLEGTVNLSKRNTGTNLEGPNNLDVPNNLEGPNILEGPNNQRRNPEFKSPANQEVQGGSSLMKRGRNDVLFVIV